VKAGWELKTLGELCEIAPRKALVKKTLTDEQLVSFVPMDQLGELVSHFTAKEDRPLSSVYKGYTYFCNDDVIIAKITPCFENGKMGVASGMTNGVGFGSSEFVPIRGQGKTLPKYLFYYLLRNDFRENGARVMSGAVGHKRVPKEYIENLPIPLPPLEEQKRIVSILDEAFEGLDRARENAEANLKSARELFVRSISDEFSKDQSIPMRNVADVAEHSLGKMLDKSKNQGTLRPYLRNVNVRWFDIDTSDLLEMKIKETEIKRYSVRKGDLLICEGGYPGRCSIWHNEETTFFQKALHRVRFEHEAYAKLLMLYLFLQDQTGELSKHFTGTGIQHFTGKALANFQMPFPEASLADKITKRIEAIQLNSNLTIARYTSKLQDISDLRQSLLKKAFAGELT